MPKTQSSFFSMIFILPLTLHLSCDGRPLCALCCCCSCFLNIFGALQNGPSTTTAAVVVVHHAIVQQCCTRRATLHLGFHQTRMRDICRSGVLVRLRHDTPCACTHLIHTTRWCTSQRCCKVLAQFSDRHFRKLQIAAAVSTVTN